MKGGWWRSGTGAEARLAALAVSVKEGNVVVVEDARCRRYAGLARDWTN
jgi:hypothetical protein